MLSLVKIEKKDSWYFYDTEEDLHTEECERAIDYYESGKYELAETILQKIVLENKYHIDSLNYLALTYEKQCKNFEAYLCSREAVRVGVSVLPKEFSWVSSSLEWKPDINKAFLRAHESLAFSLYQRGEIKSSIKIFTKMLAVNQNDNLNVRLVLPELLLQEKQLSTVVKLCEKYPDNKHPEILYTYPLALIELGKKKEAVISLKNAIKQLPLVAKELLKTTHEQPISKIFGSGTQGGLDQAYFYNEKYGAFWHNSRKDALGLLNSLAGR